MTVTILALLVGLPAVAFAAWPLLRRGGSRVLLAVPPDEREQLLEQKRRTLRALRELDFEHEAGHVSDDDYAELRARYEAEAAEVLTQLDRLGAARAREAAPRPRPAPAGAAATGWRHPLALATAGVALLVFGVAIGVGIVRYSEPDANAGMSAGAPRGPMPSETPAAAPMAAGGDPSRPIPPEIMRRMLDAARESLNAGRYAEAIAAYQAVLKRDPKNVDAMTHLGLIVAIGGHADSALETFDKALALDPNYAPALLYRGDVLYEAKRDPDGAIKSWEKFLAVVPTGADHDRVKQMIAQAQKDKATRAPK